MRPRNYDFALLIRTMLGQTRQFLEAGQQVVATAFIISDEGFGIVGLPDMPDQKAKEILYRKVSDDAKALDAYAVVLINDVTITMRSGDSKIKQDALHGQAVMPDGSVLIAVTAPYIKHPNGMFEFGPIMEKEGGTSIQTLLPAWGKPQSVN